MGRNLMRISRILVTTAAAGAALVLSAGPATAGEINGNGQPEGGQGLGAAHANSICAFSGLEDGDGAGFPGPGGAPPQNWGHVQQAERAAGATVQDLKASGFQPGDSCNGHSGFLANPPPETP
jgi:hypothetical protein